MNTTVKSNLRKQQIERGYRKGYGGKGVNILDQIEIYGDATSPRPLSTRLKLKVLMKVYPKKKFYIGLQQWLSSGRGLSRKQVAAIESDYKFKIERRRR